MTPVGLLMTCHSKGEFFFVFFSAGNIILKGIFIFSTLIFYLSDGFTVLNRFCISFRIMPTYYLFVVYLYNTTMVLSLKYSMHIITLIVVVAVAMVLCLAHKHKETTDITF